MTTTTFTPAMFADLARTAHDPNAAETVAGILNGDIDPETVEATAEWVRRCYHRPREQDLILPAVTALLDLHGVEAIRVEGEWLDNYHGDIVASYCNTGDTYAETVLLDHETGEFVLTSWGDFLENWEATHEREPEDDDSDLDENSQDDLDGEDDGIFPEDDDDSE